MKQLSLIGKTLMLELRKLYDDRDFVVGCLSIAKAKENRKTMLNFIGMAKSDGDEDMLKLAMILKKKNCSAD